MARYTQQQYDDLREAIATGAERIEYDGKTTVFRSLQHMQTLLREMEADLGITSQTSTRVVVAPSKGL